jgi:UDP-4-amino-4,6-dideoxy-N-acetyl-beta-L-altrosamine transaminase
MHRPAPLPYGQQSVDEADIAAVVEVLRGERLTTGPAVEAFENALATATGAPHVCAVNSGTAALHAAYAALGLGPGQALVTTPLTFAATANAARYLGADVIFADVRADTGCLDPEAAAAAVRPSATVLTAVDYAGHPADYPALRGLAAGRGLRLVADACHALGATLDGQPLGAWADVACLSFHPVKPITTAEGGAVLTHSSEWDTAVRTFRTHGITRRPEALGTHGAWHYAMESLGYNYRLSDLHAALGRSQLRRLDAFIAARRVIAARYSEALADLDSLEPPAVRPGAAPGWHLYVVRVREAGRRRAFFEALQARGILVQVHYIPVYHHPYWAALGYRRGLCPVAEDFAARAVSLPIFPAMTTDDVDRVVEAVHAAARETL